jgi:crotonobetainyl-CoA:carnitine CoA-transferase CaiB-like acyl-CoA transferase
MGQHSHDVLAGLGYDPARIEALFKSEIVR